VKLEQYLSLTPLDRGLCAVQIYAKPDGNIEQKVTIEA
jgi:hypothetical protein